MTLDNDFRLPKPFTLNLKCQSPLNSKSLSSFNTFHSFRSYDKSMPLLQLSWLTFSDWNGSVMTPLPFLTYPLFPFNLVILLCMDTILVPFSTSRRFLTSMLETKLIIFSSPTAVICNSHQEDTIDVQLFDKYDNAEVSHINLVASHCKGTCYSSYYLTMSRTRFYSMTSLPK